MSDNIIFDLRNDEKQIIQASGKQVFAHEREIRLTKVWQNIGNEQNGKWQFLRPVLIYKKLRWVYLCIPLTTQGNKERSYHYKLNSFGTEKESYLSLNQIKTFDAKRLVNKMGYISLEEYKHIQKIFLELLS